MLGLLLSVAPFTSAFAGGGLVIEDDVCIIEIEFYSAHFTAYQPNTRGNEQFCQQLPDTGETLFVLDYLHDSLKDVPVSFRIIRDVTGQGRYVKLKHVEAIGDLEPHTVFYQPPVVRPNASFKVEHIFSEGGSFVGIVTAGHPSNDRIYTAVFPFDVDKPALGWLVAAALLAAGAALLIMRHLKRRRAGAVSGEAA